MSDIVEKNSTREIERWIENLEGYVDAADKLQSHLNFILRRMHFISYTNPMEWNKMNEMLMKLQSDNLYWMRDLAKSFEKEIKQIRTNKRST